MADSILRLKVESQEYDNKLKRASEGIQRYADQCRKVGGTLEVVEKETLDFVRSIGQMGTVSTTAKGKINEMSSSFINLTAQYKQLTETEKQSPFGKALSQSLDQLKERTQEAKQELSDITKELNGASNIGGGGGLFSSDKLSGMLQVFGGNLMTKGFELVAGAAANFASEIQNCIQQGIELAKQGEGVRIAFGRLGRGDLLDGLREATHGTVSDLELMKQAIKFENFKLPLDDLANYLAFAQQKAKDTGESIDYLVNSIVTGLGRQSKQILDNLGISAAELTKRMNEGADMTKAVSDIIREEMSKAGGYVETAADRSARATADLQNKMEELGRTFQPIQEAGVSMFNNMVTAAIDALNKMRPFFDMFTEAGRIRQQRESHGGDSRVNQQLSRLKVARASGSDYYVRSSYNSTVQDYQKQISDINFKIASYGKPKDSIERGIVERLKEERDAVQQLFDAYKDGAKQYLQPVEIKIDTNKSIKGISDLKKQLKELEEQRKKAVKMGDQEQVENLTKQISQVKTNIGYLDPKANKTSSSSKTTQTELQENQAKINTLTQEYVRLGDESTEAARERQAEIQKEIELLQQRNGLLGLRAEQAQGRLLGYAGDFDKNTKNVGGIGMLDQATNFGKNIEIPSGGLQLSDKAMDAVNKSLNNQKKDVKGVANEWMSVTSAIQSVATAMSSIEDPAAKVMGIVAQAIATVALAFAQSLKGSVTIWDYIAGAAAGVATMISTISAIHSATGYAEGGMIKGNSYSGDNLMAMGPNGLIGLNAGEIVLNKSQQNNLASQLQSNPIGVLNLTATIRGEQIRLALNNNGRRTGRGEYVQSRNVR